MRAAALAIVLAATLAAALVGGAVAPHAIAARQDGTPAAGAEALLGSWVVRDLRPPNGGPPVALGVVTLLGDGTALVAGPGGETSLGAWEADGPGAAVLTVVAVNADASGAPNGTLSRLRAAVAVDAATAGLTGTYTSTLIEADGTVAFTYSGWWDGTRVTVEAPEPLPPLDAATAAATPTP